MLSYKTIALTLGGSLLSYFAIPSLLESSGRGYTRGLTGGALEGISNVGNKLSDENLEDFRRKLTKLISGTFDDINTNISLSIIKNYTPTILVVGAVYTATLVVLPLTVHYIYERLKYNIGKPKMAQKMRFYTWFSRINPWSNVNSKEKAPEPVFDPYVTRRISEITETAKNVVKHNGYFPFVCIEGPPGTGKTMISEAIAINSDMNYVMMAGSQFAQFIKRGEHISELNRLFDRVERQSRPTVIFIDEFEPAGASRDTLGDERKEIVGALLNRTGKGSKKFMLVVATNRIQDLDPAIRDRLDFEIHIDTPKLEEIVRIINKYALEYFGSDEHAMNTFFNKNEVNQLALSLNGWSGRKIQKLLNFIHLRKVSTVNNQLTRAIILQAVEDFKNRKTDEKPTGVPFLLQGQASRVVKA